MGLLSHHMTHKKTMFVRSVSSKKVKVIGVLSHMSHMTSHLTIYQMAILFLLDNSVVLPVKKIGFQMPGL